jgi:hypothetical protein
MTAIAEAPAMVVGDDRVVHGPVDAYVKDRPRPGYLSARAQRLSNQARRRRLGP